jgi:hypothetical protein
MVRIQKPSDYDELDTIVHRVCEMLGLRVVVEGWTRKTYQVYTGDKLTKRTYLARVESAATTNGEVVVYDDAGLPFAEALGKELERAFPIGEAVILRQQPEG